MVECAKELEGCGKRECAHSAREKERQGGGEREESAKENTTRQEGGIIAGERTSAGRVLA